MTWNEIGQIEGGRLREKEEVVTRKTEEKETAFPSKGSGHSGGQ
jgi:hypothetical protein